MSGVEPSLSKGDRAGELVDRLVENPSDLVAARAVLAFGDDAVACLLDGVKRRARGPGPGQARVALARLIRRSATAEAVPLLVETYRSDRTPLRYTLLDAIGAARSRESFTTLVEILRDDDELYSRRARAAEALGLVGDPAAVAELTNVLAAECGADPATASIAGVVERMREEIDIGPGELVLGCVLGMARLGEHSSAHLAVQFLGYKRGKREPMEASQLPEWAAKVLQVAVAPGVVTALRNALQSGTPFDLRAPALDALSYLGSKRIVPDLLRVAADRDLRLASNAQFVVTEVTGAPWADAGEQRTWWQENEARFVEGVCYRLGEPLHIPRMFASLDEDKSAEAAAEQLRVITGHDFAYATVAEAEAWWDSNRSNYEPGAVFKWGHKQDLKALET